MSLPDILQLRCGDKVLDLGCDREIYLNDAVVEWLNEHSKHNQLYLVRKANYGQNLAAAKAAELQANETVAVPMTKIVKIIIVFDDSTTKELNAEEIKNIQDGSKVLLEKGLAFLNFMKEQNSKVPCP